MRRGGGDLRGLGQKPRNPTVPLEPGAELGWLTAVKQSSGDARYTVFRCRCGNGVVRMHADVREGVAKGAVPACAMCRSAAKAEAAQLRLAREREAAPKAG